MSEINRPLSLYQVSVFIASGTHPIKPFRIPDGFELVEVLLGGRIFFEVNGENREFERGAIFWHIAGEYTIFRTPPEDPYRCLAVRFAVPENRRTAPRISGWSTDATLDPFVDEVIGRFHDETIDRTYLCEYLHRRLFWESYIFNRRSAAAGYPKPLARALAIFREGGKLDVSVKEMAAKAGVSEPYLYALFNKHLQVSPHQYLLNYRLRQARIRLAGSDDNIKAISEECGFENLESFYRAFRRSCGVPPGEYRKRHQSMS